MRKIIYRVAWEKFFFVFVYILSLSPSIMGKVIKFLVIKSVRDGNVWEKIWSHVKIYINYRKISISTSMPDICLLQIISEENVRQFLQYEINTPAPAITAKIYGFATGNIDFMPYRIGIYKFNNGIVTSGSDIVRLGASHCYWYKKGFCLFDKIVPNDSDFLIAENDCIVATKPVPEPFNVECGFSLLGVHDAHWAHFLLQYLPKLEVVNKLSLSTGESVTILASNNLDSNSRDLLEMCRANYSFVSIRYVAKGESVRCKFLYYVDQASWITERTEYAMLGDNILSTYTAAFLSDAVRQLRKGISLKSAGNEATIKRIYLRRIGRRAVINLDDVDSVFEKWGFSIIYPHEYTLEEKVKLFAHAEIIAGPYSSGFMNSMFCSKGAKLLMLCHLNRVWGTGVPTLAKTFGVESYILPGDACNCDFGPQASYVIDCGKLDMLISQLLNNSHQSEIDDL